MRLIDADALISFIDCGHLRSPTEVCFSERDVVGMLEKAPTIDAEPVKQGKWIDPEGIHEWCCNLCGNIAPNDGYDNGANYCDYCGAKMEEGREDENADHD